MVVEKKSLIHQKDNKPLSRATMSKFVKPFIGIKARDSIKSAYEKSTKAPSKIGESNYIDFRNKNISRDEKIRIFHDVVQRTIIPQGGYIRLEVYGKDSKIYYTLHNGNKNDLLDLIDESKSNTGNASYSKSDAVADYVASSDIEYVFFNYDTKESLQEKYAKNTKLTKSLFTNKRTYKKTDGSFFNYKHLINNNVFTPSMEELQIFYVDNDIDYSDNCFIKSLRGQIDEQILNKIKGEILTKNIDSKSITKLAKDHNLFITLYKPQNNSNKRIIEKFGDSESINKATICLLDNHYIKYIDNMGFTIYFLKHYETIKDLNEPHRIYNTLTIKDKLYYKRDDKHFTDSFTVVKYLLDNKDKFLKHIDVSEEIINDPNCYDHTKIPNINIDDNCREIIYKPKKDKSYCNIIAFDFETYCDDIGKHIPYLVHFSSFDLKDSKTFYGPSCARDFLNHLVKLYGHNDTEKGSPLLMYAHNMTYDASFILNELTWYKLLEKDGLNISVEGGCKNGYNKLNLLIKDSWRLIPDKLSKFNDIFGLKINNKEVMYYDMYNHNTIDHIESMTKKEMDPYIKTFNDNSITIDKKKEKQFYDNLKAWDCVNDDGTYDLLKYSQKYCVIDVDILIKGLDKFYDLWKTLTLKDDVYINIHNFFSLPSLANELFRSLGCFNDCYEFSGILGKWFMNFQHGGRVMTANNKKNIIDIGKFIQDFDGVSLYPSAMHFMHGYAKGKPKIIPSGTSIKTIKEYDYYFIKVKILKIKKHRAFPLLCKKNKNTGVKDWTDYLEGEDYFFDRYQLEDAIKYHGVTFKFIEGMYFDEGFNTKIKTEIKTIFDSRIKAKKDKNIGLSNLLKLIMNSSYGKLAQKPCDEKIEIIRNSNIDSFINYNYNSLISATQHDGDKFYKCKLNQSINKSYSSPHQSCIILSYSKRIMNDVMCLAEDNDINLFYQDTDSIHMFDEDVNKLADLYKEKFDKELVGSHLGQFHSDFACPEGYKDSVSKKFIALGKKCYYDQIECTNIDTNEKILIDHIRMKGVTDYSIIHKAKQLNKSVFDVYKDLYDGESHLFDLSVNNKIRFQKSNGQFYRGEVLTRNISFA
jgi:hypothetical protein